MTYDLETDGCIQAVDADRVSFDGGAAVFWNDRLGAESELVVAYGSGQWERVRPRDGVT